MRKLMLPGTVLLLFAMLAALLAGTVRAEGSAPVAENLDLATYRGVSVGGRLSATDPEGGPLRYQITTKPAKGTLDLGEDGHFVYTPAEGKRGKDYFGYQVTDPDGNVSQEATVIIKIQKQRSKISYTDTAGLGSAYAAVRLAEEGLYTGAQMGGQYVFSPEEPVTRQEFLTMCMLLSGSGGVTGVRSTGFADDASIEAWAKPYVSAALRRGVISGYSAGAAGTVFDPERPVSVLEAAVMLDRALGLTDAVTTWFSYADTVPAWALQSASNVSACGVLPYGCSFTDASLSRGAAAEMLTAAMDLRNRR